MRAALIILPEPDAEAVTIAGRSVPERQLEFALASGTKTLILQGNGASPEALALRQSAERSGARVAVINDARALSGLVSTSDDLLVLQPGLLPSARKAPAMAGSDPHIMVLPGDLARPGGFERINLQRAWAGAMVVPGGLVEGLHELGDGVDAPSGLLRLALQYGVKEIAVPLEWLDSEAWAIATLGQAEALSQSWIERALAPVSAFAPARWIGRWLVRMAAPHIGGGRHAALAGATASGILAAGAVALAWYGFAWAAFMLTGLSAIAAWSAIAIQRLLAMPFGAMGRIGLARWLPDLALLVCGFLAIEGMWNERIFPPLVLFIALRWLPAHTERAWLRLLRDRLVVALSIAFFAALGLPATGVMLVALLALAPSLAMSGTKRG